jgi:hypothetical protein
MDLRKKRIRTTPRPGMITSQGSAAPAASDSTQVATPSFTPPMQTITPLQAQPQADYFSTDYHVNPPQKKSKKKTVVISAAALIVFISVAVMGVIARNAANPAADIPQDFSDFQAAAENKTAFNCEIKVADEDINYLISADDKWGKIFTKDIDTGMNVLYLLDDRIYLWLDDESQDAAAYDYNTDGIGFLEWLAGLSSQDSELSCHKPAEAYFVVPDKNWADGIWEQEIYEE